MVALIFIFDPSSGQVQAITGQISKLKTFFQTYLSYPVLSQDSKNVICFDVRQLGMSKNAIQKVTLSPLPSFWVIAQPEIKILA